MGCGGCTVTMRISCGLAAAGGATGAALVAAGGGSRGRCIVTVSCCSPSRQGESRSATSWPRLSVQR